MKKKTSKKVSQDAEYGPLAFTESYFKKVNAANPRLCYFPGCGLQATTKALWRNLIPLACCNKHGKKEVL